ncbi:hypothetical protein L2750_03345 [Shewanella submarina]|uniref:7,8-dihydro-6-hydroxymethylpterin-pyrophosphokinase domain-containing protein n=1 Tax=Shewanella submarina TaxID=2016376 RepID=A0ABV7GGM6_9GAMM|nr:hypothetical protein [Shewanella submarina]MCL1036192.1 hypothetical protein [Shewanella submarina]
MRLVLSLLLTLTIAGCGQSEAEKKYTIKTFTTIEQIIDVTREDVWTDADVAQIHIQQARLGYMVEFLDDINIGLFTTLTKDIPYYAVGYLDGGFERARHLVICIDSHCPTPEQLRLREYNFKVYQFEAAVVTVTDNWEIRASKETGKVSFSTSDDYVAKRKFQGSQNVLSPELVGQEGYFYQVEIPLESSSLNMQVVKGDPVSVEFSGNSDSMNTPFNKSYTIDKPAVFRYHDHFIFVATDGQHLMSTDTSLINSEFDKAPRPIDVDILAEWKLSTDRPNTNV